MEARIGQLEKAVEKIDSNISKMREDVHRLEVSMTKDISALSERVAQLPSKDYIDTKADRNLRWFGVIATIVVTIIGAIVTMAPKIWRILEN